VRRLRRNPVMRITAAFFAAGVVAAVIGFGGVVARGADAAKVTCVLLLACASVSLLFARRDVHGDC
jgi:uncharacterized membrane protein YtjA (UPF0391 family)